MINDLLKYKAEDRKSVEEILESKYFVPESYVIHEKTTYPRPPRRFQVAAAALPSSSSISHSKISGTLTPIHKLTVNKEKGIYNCYGVFVYQGLFEGKKPVAIKRFQRSSQIDELVKNEAELLLKATDHVNILRYYCYEMDEHFQYAVYGSITI